MLLSTRKSLKFVNASNILLFVLKLFCNLSLSLIDMFEFELVPTDSSKLLYTSIFSSEIRVVFSFMVVFSNPNVANLARTVIFGLY